MSVKPDGGLAFPHPGTPRSTDDFAFYPEPGMTLRDYFAAQADVSDYKMSDTSKLCAFVGEPEPDRDEPDYIAKMIVVSTKAAAKLRYMLADAMIAERDK